MKKKKVNKKLVLNKRTVTDFSRNEMKNMKGGVETDYCTLTCTLKALCCEPSLECTLTCPEYTCDHC